jgi:hypothetical protein
MLETSLKKGEDKQEKAAHGALVAKGELFSIFPKRGWPSAAVSAISPY